MKKKLTKKQIIIICIAVATFLLVAATAITLPIVLLNTSKIPEPSVRAFDQQNDMYITVEWEKVGSAGSYSLQYCYGNVLTEVDDIVTVRTDGLFYRIERQIGVLAFRVKSNFEGKDSDYSEWQYFNVSALKLNTTTNITLNTSGVISWPNVKYLDRNTLKTVPSYVVDLTFAGEYFDTVTYSGMECTENTLSNIAKYYLINLMTGYDETIDDWSDITLTVKVKCLNYYDTGTISTTTGYEFLYNAYNESEYYTQDITIDENLYLNIKG